MNNKSSSLPETAKSLEELYQELEAARSAGAILISEINMLTKECDRREKEFQESQGDTTKPKSS